MTPIVAPLVVIGVVDSALTDVADAPRQPDEHGAVPATLVIDAAYRDGLDGIREGDEIIVVTWLHLATRDKLSGRPRNNTDRPFTGVFATRSPHRPNPIGLHHATVTAISADGLSVDGSEAISGTPILDIKPALEAPEQR